VKNGAQTNLAKSPRRKLGDTAWSAVTAFPAAGAWCVEPQGMGARGGYDTRCPRASARGFLVGVTISPTASRRELNRAAGAKGFVGGQHDAEAVDRIAHVVGEVVIVLDRVEKQLLLEQAEAVVVGLTRAVDRFVGLRE